MPCKASALVVASLAFLTCSVGAAPADATTLSCDPSAYDNHIGTSGTDLHLSGTPVIRIGSHGGDTLISSRVFVNGAGTSLTIDTPGRIVMDGDFIVDEGASLVLRGQSVDQIRCSKNFAVCADNNGNGLAVGGRGTLELSVQDGGVGVNSCTLTEFVVQDLTRTQLEMRSMAGTACLVVAKQTSRHPRMEFDTQIYQPNIFGGLGVPITAAQVLAVGYSGVKVGPHIAVCGH